MSSKKRMGGSELLNGSTPKRREFCANDSSRASQ
jgi:hypothetical protein